jgi:hypothetical protein
VDVLNVYRVEPPDLDVGLGDRVVQDLRGVDRVRPKVGVADGPIGDLRAGDRARAEISGPDVAVDVPPATNRNTAAPPTSTQRKWLRIQPDMNETSS